MSLSGLPASISQLDACCNRISSLEPAIQSCTLLTRLCLSNNQITSLQGKSAGYIHVPLCRINEVLSPIIVEPTLEQHQSPEMQPGISCVPKSSYATDSSTNVQIRIPAHLLLI